MQIRDYIIGLNDLGAIDPMPLKDGFYIPRINHEALSESGEEISSIVLYNMNHCVVDNDMNIVARGMQKLIQYKVLPRAEQMAFLGDRMTMIEFHQGRPFYASLYQGKVVIFSKHDDIFDICDIEKIKLSIRPALEIVCSKKDEAHSFAMKLSLSGDVYLEAIVSNSLMPEYYNEKGIDMIATNFIKNSVMEIKRPMHYTTSLNESVHKANTEWIARNGDNYCLILNRLKREIA